MFSKTDIIRTHLFCILLLSAREQRQALVDVSIHNGAY